MARFATPKCKAPDPDGRGTCDVPMQPLGERHPSFGPNYRPGGWVFLCRRCGAVRFIEEEHLCKHVERTR